jgi:tripartite-type tricarboxylate transporter receptor subunit TctC
LAWGTVRGASFASAADSWPNRAVRVVVTTAAASGSDLLARALCDRLAPAFKQPFIVENKPGASGVIATMAVIKSPADGYTLLYSTASATVMAEALIPTLPFSTLRDLTPVALNAIGGVLLIVNPAVPARTLSELITLVKRNPEAYPYGSWGVGSNGHLTMEWLKQRTGMKTAHVAYKSSQTLLMDLVAGTVPIGWLDLSSPLPFIEDGRLKAIAINGDTRNPRLPELKTMTEQGQPFPAKGFQGLFAPAGTPVDIVERLNAEVNRILIQPDYQAVLRRLNVDPPSPVGPAAFRNLISDNLRIWKKIVTEANVQLDS